MVLPITLLYIFWNGAAHNTARSYLEWCCPSHCKTNVITMELFCIILLRWFDAATYYYLINIILISLIECNCYGRLVGRMLKSILLLENMFTMVLTTTDRKILGSIPAIHTSSGLVAQSCNPATRGQVCPDLEIVRIAFFALKRWM